MVEGEFKIVVTSVAQKSIEIIYAYYEKEVSKVIAQKIKNEIFKELFTLSVLPERKSILRSEKDYIPKIRFAQKMSFKILFQVYKENHEVVVLEIIHDKENPKKWESI